MSDAINDTTGRDPLELAEEVPNVAMLQEELQYAWDMDGNGRDYARIAWKEGIRYNWWKGQTGDGLKWRKHMGDRAKPYDGAPDCRVFLADGIINSNVDLLYLAFFGARVKFAPTSAQRLGAMEAAEARAVISWMLHGPLRKNLIDDVELAAQLQETIGWCVLHPNWRKESAMELRTLTMAEVMNVAQKAIEAGAGKGPNFTEGNEGNEGGQVQASGAGDARQDAAQPAGRMPALQEPGALMTLLANAPAMIKDPALEDPAVELFQALFPGMGKREARKVIRDLRTKNEAEFPVEAPGPNVPEVRVLVPGLHFVLPPEGQVMGDEGRFMPVRMFFTEQGLRARAAEEGWNPEFVEAVCATKGVSIDQFSEEVASDLNMRLIEVFYDYNLANDEHGVPGMYCTVLSMNVKPDAGGTTKKDYGKHGLVQTAGGAYPFVNLRTEVNGLKWSDARGVPETVFTQQRLQKNSLDMLYVREQLTTTPPLQRKGGQASKLPPGLAPLGVVNNPGGGEWSWFSVPPGNSVDSAKLVEYVQAACEDYHGIQRPGGVPAKAMARNQRKTMRWLGKWGEVLWQLLVLAYYNLSQEELTAILGRPPVLTPAKLETQALLLWFEPRSMDSDWLDDMIENLIKLLGIDIGGTIDRSKVVAFILAYLDPALGEEVTLDQEGAKEAMYTEVRDEINSMALGNKPQLRQNDPTAGKKMEFATNVIKGNPAFTAKLSPVLPTGQPNPQHDPGFAENVQTYLKNLAHNHQEMVTSKVQGRLGTQDTGAGPVVSGAD